MAMFGIAFYWNSAYGFSNPFNPYNSAIGQLNRAITAQTPDGVVHYILAAKQQLPENYQSEQISRELTNLVNRANNISSLSSQDKTFNSEMTDIHFKLNEIIQRLLS